jgi:transcriptional regulator with XRE-family HTH domain
VSEKRTRRLTANQIVASNLWWARETRHWTQEEAAERLSVYLGVRWSKASYSAAERSRFRRDRIRHFTADELLAFATVFEEPVQYFFVPHWDVDEEELAIVAGENEQALPQSLAEYAGSVFGTAYSLNMFTIHMDQIFKTVPRSDDFMDAEEFRTALRGIIRSHSLSSVSLIGWHDALLEITDFIADLDRGVGSVWDKAFEEAQREGDEPES